MSCLSCFGDMGVFACDFYDQYGQPVASCEYGGVYAGGDVSGCLGWCATDPLKWYLPPIGVGQDGQRWARPAEGAAPYNSRNALGFVAPLGSQIMAVPERTLFEVAPVWKNKAEECFNTPLCDAHDATGCYHYSCEGNPPPCDDCVVCTPVGQCDIGQGEFIGPPGTMKDCALFEGIGVPPIEARRCRLCSDETPTPFNPRSYLVNADRMFNYAEARSGICTSNLALACWGHTGDIPYDLCRGPSQGAQNYHIEYQEPGGQQLWNYLKMHFNAQLQEHHAMLYDDLSAGNLALRKWAIARMNEVGNREPDAYWLEKILDADNHNGELDYWGGGWESRRIDREIIYEFPEAYLARSRCRVHARLVLLSLGVEVSLYIQSRSPGPYCCEDFGGGWTPPEGCECHEGRNHCNSSALLQARIAFTGTFGLLAELIDPCPGVTLEPGADHWARASNGDEIVLKDDEGRIVYAPRSLRWIGARGAISTRKWSDLWDCHTVCRLCPDRLMNYCCALAKGINADSEHGYIVEAVPGRTARFIPPDDGAFERSRWEHLALAGDVAFRVANADGDTFCPVEDENGYC